MYVCTYVLILIAASATRGLTTLWLLTGSTIVALSFNMYAVERRISVHGAGKGGIRAGRGLLAACGSAVHYLKAMVNRRIEDGVGVRGYLSNVVLQRREY